MPPTAGGGRGSAIRQLTRSASRSNGPSSSAPWPTTPSRRDSSNGCSTTPRRAPHQARRGRRRPWPVRCSKSGGWRTRSANSGYGWNRARPLPTPTNRQEADSVIAASAIVLAGGRSSRMGRPKALLPFDGEPLIAHVVDTLRALVEEVIVVAAPGQELPPLPVTLVYDEVAYQGPVGGICYGLAASKGEVSFVTSCDSVFLDQRLIRYILTQIADHDVVVPRWEGRFQPLHAAYRRTVQQHLEAQLARGDFR